MLEGHSVSMNTAQWGSKVGLDAASNDRTVRLWNRNGAGCVLLPSHSHRSSAGPSGMVQYAVHRMPAG